MKTIIDISLPLTVEMPVWPGSPNFEITQVASLQKDGCNETKLMLGSHTGTHIDAPYHFIEGGVTVDCLSLDALVGRAYVLECTGVKEITSDVLQSLNVPTDVERLLLKTDNSELRTSADHNFYEDFAALTADGAQWVVSRGIKLVGIDYLSIQRFYDSNATHEILLEAGVVILEGLNLAEVSQGFFDLTCLPLNIVGAEGAPARAILRSCF